VSGTTNCTAPTRTHVSGGMSPSHVQAWSPPAQRSVAVQLTPEAAAERRDEICKYLEQFFEPDHFSVYWGDLAACLGQVYRLWKGG
jgi:hypothetical protein